MALHNLQTKFDNHFGEVLTKMQYGKQRAIENKKIDLIKKLKKRIRANNKIIKYEEKPHLKDEARRVNKVLESKVKGLESEVYCER